MCFALKFQFVRLFISIALTDALREQIIKSREHIKQKCFTPEQAQRMRWINETEYHVTQYFIGEVSGERVEEAKSVVQEVAASTSSFTITSDRFEFKPRNNPRLLWLRFRSIDAYADLQTRLHNASVEAGLSNNEINDDPIPHVTLIRLKHVKPNDCALPPLEPHDVHVERIELMQSFMKPNGAEYRLLERFALK